MEYILSLFLSLLGVQNNGQLLYPIVGEYDGKTAQGMAIYNNKAYLTNNGGYCRVINLITGEMEREFMLASANDNNLANTICFGKEYEDDHDTPVLYVSEYKNLFRCFVEQISSHDSKLVQTISAQRGGKVVRARDWITDVEGEFIYSIERSQNNQDSIGSFVHVITKYHLPKLSEGDYIVFMDNDILDSFEIVFPNILQGGTIKDGKLYLPTGSQERNRDNVGSERVLFVVDLESGQIIKEIDLTCVTMNEPQDVDFYNDRFLLFSGQDGGIYEVNLK